MYRVICELINNTLRHANASKISIDLQLQGDVLYLEYEDNGMGFDVKQAESDGGMGLSNMQYRLNSGNWGYQDFQRVRTGNDCESFYKV